MADWLIFGCGGFAETNYDTEQTVEQRSRKREVSPRDFRKRFG